MTDLARKVFELFGKKETGSPERRNPTEKPLQSDPSWLCLHCGQPVTIDDVFPSLDGERTLTMWRCDSCQVVAVTPDEIKTPPAVWVKMVQQ